MEDVISVRSRDYVTIYVCAMTAGGWKRRRSWRARSISAIGEI